MKKIMLRYLLSIVFAMGWGATLHAQDLIIQYDEANAPYMYAEESLEALGLYPRIVEAIAKDMGLIIKQKAVPWKRALVDADSAMAGIGGAYVNDERLAKWDYSAPLYQEQIVLMSRADRVDVSSDLDRLQGMYIGVLNGWSYGQGFDERRYERVFQVEEADSDTINLKKLLGARLDVMLVTRMSALSLMKNPSVEGRVKLADKPLLVNTAHIAFSKSKDMTYLLQRFDAGLAALETNGTIDRIVHEEVSMTK